MNIFTPRGKLGLENLAATVPRRVVSQLDLQVLTVTGFVPTSKGCVNPNSEVETTCIMISVRQASAYAYTGAHTCRNAIALGRSRRLLCLLRSATIAPLAHRPFSPKRRDQKKKVVEEAIALK
jgi:hypothetical protein